MVHVYDPYYADDETGYFHSVIEYTRIPVHRPKKVKSGSRILINKKSKGLRKYYNHSYTDSSRSK